MFDLYAEVITENVVKILNEVDERSSDWNVILDKIIKDILKAESEAAFENERSPDMVDFVPSRSAIERNGKTLTDTHFLRNSMQEDETYILANNMLSVAPQVEYAAVHFFGLEHYIEGYGMFEEPIREFSGIGDKKLDAGADQILNYILFNKKL